MRGRDAGLPRLYPTFLRRHQSPALLQLALHGAEDETVDDEAQDDDQDHHGNYLTHIVEVAAHHEQLAESKTEEDHFGLDQRPPSESEALFQTGDYERQASRQQDRPEQAKSRGSQVTSGHGVNFGHLFTPILHRDGY